MQIRSLLNLSSALVIGACASAPESQFAPVGIAGGGEPGIYYDEDLRRITIIGFPDVENNAVVNLVPPVLLQGGGQSVFVSLESGGVASGDSLEGLFPFTTTVEGIPNPPNPDGNFDSIEPDIIELVEEIVFYGGSDVDRFENNTHIPAEARGNSGNDTLIGGSGDDKLYGQSGNDTLIGGAGDDTLYGLTGNDRLDGQEGEDTLYTGPGSDSASGGEGDDQLTASGASGNEADENRLCGGDGADILEGDPLAEDNFLAAVNGNVQAGVAVDDDSDSDVLYGTAQGDRVTRYEFTAPEDIIYENGALLSPDQLDFPTPFNFSCN